MTGSQRRTWYVLERENINRDAAAAAAAAAATAIVVCFVGVVRIASIAVLTGVRFF